MALTRVGFTPNDKANPNKGALVRQNFEELLELQKYVRSENVALSEMIDEYYTDGAIISWIEGGLGYLFDADGSLVYDLPAQNL